MKRVTRKHIEAQQAAADRYAAARGLHLERAPGGNIAPVDYLARASPRYGEPVVEVLEFKCRGCGVGAFPDVWLEDRKVAALQYGARLYGCDAYLVVEWANGEMRRIHVDDVARAAGGSPVVRHRRDRGDERDSDLVWCVPVRMMERVLTECIAVGYTDVGYTEER